MKGSPSALLFHIELSVSRQKPRGAFHSKTTGACTESISTGPEFHVVLTFPPASQSAAGRIISIKGY